MKKNLISLLLFFSCVWGITAQNSIKGVVVDGDSENPIEGVTVAIKNSTVRVLTNDKGVFLIKNLSDGNYILEISYPNYETQNFPVELSKSDIDFSTIYLYKDLTEEQDISIINITDDELNADDGFTDNIAGLLQSSRDVFLSAAAFDFSATFFRPRGLDNANGKVLINGIEMNKLLNGRPQWSNWGGLNDLQRNQAFTRGVSPNENTFGDIAGVNNITMRASSYGEGTRISYASANRSYQGRVMASHSSGALDNGWSYAFLASRRFGGEGYINGTLYDSNSFFATVEKQLGANHSLNVNVIYAQNRRGRSTALTNEIYQLKGRQYNPFWGEINGVQKNTRERSIVEPIFMANHYWDISEKTSLNTNISYQTGYIGNTRIDNGGTRLVSFGGQDVYIGGARNPSPDYYQNLPSYFLNRDNLTAYDYQLAYVAQQKFVNNGQFDWDKLFIANQNATALGGNSIYAVQEDRVDDSMLSFNSILFTELNENIKLNASISYRSLNNETYAKIKDLLDGTGFLDVDFFAETQLDGAGAGNIAQSDVRNPNRIAAQGERYKYNYEMNASVVESFVQAQFNYTKLDFYLGASTSATSYQRNGLYENGYFQGDLSYGKSEKLDFQNYGLKGGLTYKISGQHLLDFNTAYITKAPNIRNSFENARQNNITVLGIDSEKIYTIDASYILRTPKVRGRLTGYYTSFKDGTDINFFFTESGSTFTQEVLTDIDRKNFGGELGIEAQVTPTIKLKGVAAMGQFTFNNNPSLYYASDDFLPNPSTGETRRTYGDGKAKLKSLHVSGGPERAFQLGFEYRDPDFWWFGATVNHFSRTFVDPSALKRSDAFSTDFEVIPSDVLFQGTYRSRLDFGGPIEGFTYNDFDQDIARELLRQEQFPSYFLVNLTGGKSWKIGDYFVGFFATINNLLNQEYRTGGFEQSRRIGYRDQLQEQTNPNGPVFGNRYFFGNGTTYFVNLYLRF